MCTPLCGRVWNISFLSWNYVEENGYAEGIMIQNLVSSLSLFRCSFSFFKYLESLDLFANLTMYFSGVTFWIVFIMAFGYNFFTKAWWFSAPNHTWFLAFPKYCSILATELFIFFFNLFKSIGWINFFIGAFSFLTFSFLLPCFPRTFYAVLAPIMPIVLGFLLE